MQTSTFNDTQLQFRDVMLPGNGYGGSNNSSSGGINYNPSLPPPPTSSPLPWCHAPTSEADYYGHGMALCSSSESLTHCNPLDHNSYSPHDSFSSSSSSCYNSPTRLEPSYHSLTSEQPHDLFCPPTYWPGQEESFPAPEYAPYYNPTDYPYACPVEDNYFKRDFPMSSEMCYNVL
ncbi:colorectal cancer associated 2 [Embiotoca jacksoni]|uniref:colorectal cancer associated 2 n=1 Tax=Embiotoca jacksoni TaxID=100190 RepID=UPI003703C091